jgi:ABC-type amino acid transport substrate-binding protein
MMNLNLGLIAAALSSLLSFQSFASDQIKLKVGLIETGRLPYFSGPTGKREGVYFDLLDKVSKETQIEFEYVYLPQKRIRVQMASGHLDLEPGIAPSWRNETLEQLNSVYSIPFMSSEEVWVFHNKEIKISNDFTTLIPCNILGFNLLKEQLEASKHPTIYSDEQALKLLQIGRCDYTVMPLFVVQYYTKIHNRNYIISAPHHTYELSLRLHKKNQHLLPKINNALKKILEKEALKKILSNYL